MTREDFRKRGECAMFEIVISLLIVAIIVIAILYIISIWIYKRAPSNMGFIRTGFLGTKVCLGKGALVLPVFHENQLGLARDHQVRGQPGAGASGTDCRQYPYRCEYRALCPCRPY